jgi:hypothetical protein
MSTSELRLSCHCAFETLHKSESWHMITFLLIFAFVVLHVSKQDVLNWWQNDLFVWEIHFMLHLNAILFIGFYVKVLCIPNWLSIHGPRDIKRSIPKFYRIKIRFWCWFFFNSLWKSFSFFSYIWCCSYHFWEVRTENLFFIQVEGIFFIVFLFMSVVGYVNGKSHFHIVFLFYS